MKSTFLAAVVGMLLVGCSGSHEEELREWMASERNRVQPRIEPLPEPKQFSPEAYSQERVPDPFSVQKLTQALKGDIAQVATNAALVAPEMARRKEPLEAFPLDVMTMVGSLNKGGQQTALLKVDNLLYQVRINNHLGQNFGRITRITESEITLREIVQDATGEWIERPATLQLQESAK